LQAQVTFDVAWQALTIDNLQVVIQVASVVKLLGMAHRDIPPWNQVRDNPGSTGCPDIFQFREIIRTLPSWTVYCQCARRCAMARHSWGACRGGHASQRPLRPPAC